MINGEDALVRFERDLNAWITDFESTTSEGDHIWIKACDLEQLAEDLSAQTPRMKGLHEKLHSALNIMVGQAGQREKFLQELRALQIQTDPLPGCSPILEQARPCLAQIRAG